MGKQITIKPGYSRVILPNGRAYDGGSTVVLSDVDFDRMPDRLLALVEVGDTVPDPSTGGGGGTGGASPEQVKQIMAETLLPGDGISIEEVDDKIQVANTVSAVGIVRPWAAAELSYAQPFDVSTVAELTGWTHDQAGGVSVMDLQQISNSIAGSRPPYTQALRVPGRSGSSTGTTKAILTFANVPSLVGKSITRVVLRHSLQRADSGNIAGQILLGAVVKADVATLTVNPSASPWATLDMAVSGSPTTLSINTTKNASGGGSAGGTGWWITGVEVYTQPMPWMLNEIAAYEGSLWRSTQDNNPHTPGSGQGWVDLSAG